MDTIYQTNPSKHDDEWVPTDNKNIPSIPKDLLIEKGNADYKHMKPIVVGSVWGAIASLPIVNVFGFILFQAFLFSTTHFGIFSFIFLAIYIKEQTELLSKINNYVHNKEVHLTTLSLKDTTKIVIGLLFLLILITFQFGYYPFPRAQEKMGYTLLFYIVSWVISAGITVINKSRYFVTVSLVNKNKRGVLIALCIPFAFIASLMPTNTMYLFLIIPLFSIYILLQSWMVES